MEIKRIDFNSPEFKEVMKATSKKITIFNEKADYYCACDNGTIMGICGVVKYKNGYKFNSLFMHEKYRKKHIMTKMVKHLIGKYGKATYYTQAIETSVGLFKRLGFEQTSDPIKFKYFTRTSMILRA